MPWTTRSSLAMALFTSPEPGAGDFEWIDIGDKLACVIIRYRGVLEVEEVRARAEEILPFDIALEVTRDREPLSLKMGGVDVTDAATMVDYK